MEHENVLFEHEPCIIIIPDVKTVQRPAIEMEEYGFGEYLA